MSIQRLTTDKTNLGIAINEVAEMVASTMGPYPKNVTITRLEIGQEVRGSVTINDGLRILERLFSDDPMRQCAYERIVRACRATHHESGDGTSSTAILFAAMYNAFVSRHPNGDARAAAILHRNIEMICEMIQNSAMKLDANGHLGIIQRVAKIAMHDHPWASDVAALLYDLGKDGSFSVQMAKDGKFKTEKREGFKWNAGVSSSAFYNLPGKYECHDAFVVVIAGEVGSPEEIKGILSAYNAHLIHEQASALPLIIVCPRVVGNAMSALSRGQVKGSNVKMPVCVVSVPESEDGYELMEDIAAVCGTKVFDKLQGWSAADMNITINDFGRISHAIIMDRSATFRPSELHLISDRIEVLTARMKELEDAPKERMRVRIANLNGAFGIIHVPMATESELNYIRETMEDGCRAVQSAMEHGVLPGAGRAIQYTIGEIPSSSESDTRYFLESIATAIMQALGITERRINTLAKEDHFWATTDLKGNSIVNGLEEGILDNALSVISSLKNAAQEALLLANTQFFIVNEFNK